MGASRRRGRTTAAVLAAVALTCGLAAGCGGVDTALDCVRSADAVADNVTDLQQAVEDTGGTPGRADASLDAISENLGAIGDRTDDTDVNAAVDRLDRAAGTVRRALREGDTSPDLTPVTDAAGELTKVCTP